MVSAGTGIATGLFTFTAAGILGALYLAPRDRLGRFFSALHAGLALSFLFLALPLRPALLGGPPGAVPDTVAAIAAAGTTVATGLGLLFVTLLYLPGGRGGIGVVPGGRPGTWVLGLAIAAALTSTASDGWSASEGGASAWFYGINAITAAAVLGSVIVAMLLGHWYLVRLHLPENHLTRFVLILGAAIGLRAVFFAAGLFVHGSTSPGGLASFLSGVAVDRGFIFWQRVLFGLLLPAVLAVMAYQTARMRATMSATGILYVAVIFVLIGEFLARYLVVAGAGPM